MTLHYNRKSEKPKRRLLRNNPTYLENILWQYLRRKQLGVRILRQYSVDKFVIDFYSPEIKLAIELDGGVHNMPDNKAYDLDRQQYIEKFGITFCRITNEEFEGNPEKALMRIETAISELLTCKKELHSRQRRTSPALPFNKGEGDRVGFGNAMQ